MRKILFIASGIFIFFSCTKDVDQNNQPDINIFLALDTGSVKTFTTLELRAEIDNEEDIEILNRGFCYGLDSLPTIQNDNTQESDFNFNATLENLWPSTEYYVRAYATTEKGTVYSESHRFTTSKLENTMWYWHYIYRGDWKDNPEYTGSTYAYVTFTHVDNKNYAHYWQRHMGSIITSYGEWKLIGDTLIYIYDDSYPDELTFFGTFDKNKISGTFKTTRPYADNPRFEAVLESD